MLVFPWNGNDLGLLWSIWHGLTTIPYIIADEVNAIVLDVGTYQVKAGYAGEDAPKFICPSVRLI